MFDSFDQLWSLYDGVVYDKLPFSPSQLQIVTVFVWIGVVLAFFISFYNNYYLGGFVERLCREGAETEESALTLAEAGYAEKKLLQSSLRDGSVLRRTVQVAKEAGDGGAERYFVPREAQATAQKRYRVRGNGPIALIVGILATSVIAYLFLIFGPWIMQSFDQLLSSFSAF